MARSAVAQVATQIRRITSIAALFALTALVYLGAHQEQGLALDWAPSPVNTPCVKLCDVVESGDALAIEVRLESRGWTCTAGSRLTDTIVVDTEDGARVVTFDQAWKLAHERGAWVRAYCVKADSFQVTVHDLPGHPGDSLGVWAFLANNAPTVEASAPSAAARKIGQMASGDTVTLDGALAGTWRVWQVSSANTEPHNPVVDVTLHARSAAGDTWVYLVQP